MTNQALKLKPNIVVFAVLSGVSPSASLASSWSVTTANSSKREAGWSLQLVSGSGSLPLLMGCGSKFTESAFLGQLVHEYMPK